MSVKQRWKKGQQRSGVKKEEKERTEWSYSICCFCESCESSSIRYVCMVHRFYKFHLSVRNDGRREKDTYHVETRAGEKCKKKKKRDSEGKIKKKKQTPEGGQSSGSPGLSLAKLCPWV